MVKPYRIILCWILTLSLVWLPLSSSAAFSGQTITSQSESGEHCEYMQAHKASAQIKMSGKMSSMLHHQSAVSSNIILQQTLANNLASHELISHKSCCDDCKSHCQCQNKSACGNITEHQIIFILSAGVHRLIEQAVKAPVSSFAHFTAQIISPDIRPPIV